MPEQLRQLLAELVAAAPEQIVLGNSTSHGLHLIANGPPRQPDEEVLVLAGDYPATAPEELEAAITPHTLALHDRR